MFKSEWKGWMLILFGVSAAALVLTVIALLVMRRDPRPETETPPESNGGPARELKAPPEGNWGPDPREPSR